MLKIILFIFALYPVLSFSQSYSFIKGIDHTEGNNITHLPNGAVLHDARMEMVRNATNSIYLSAFSITPDSIGLDLFKVLCQKAKDKLDVRLLVSHVNSSVVQKHTDVLKKCGAFVISFDPQNMLYVLHEKLLIVDGQKVITGGSGYSLKYLKAAPDSYDELFGPFKKGQIGWYDSDYLVEGPAACKFHGLYRTNFFQLANFKGWVDNIAEIWELGGPREFALIWHRYYGIGRFKNCLPAKVKSAGTERAIAVLGNPYTNNERSILKVHLASINQTVKGEEIRLYSPYFVPGSAYVNALVAAVNRGVRVTVITNTTISTDEVKYSKTIFLAMMKQIGPLLKAGGKLFLWDRMSTLHRKGGVYGKVSFFGSDNLDNRGQEYQSESVIFTDSDSVREEAIDHFERDLQNSIPLTIEITQSVSDSASWFEKLKAHRLTHWF